MMSRYERLSKITRRETLKAAIEIQRRNLRYEIHLYTLDIPTMSEQARADRLYQINFLWRNHRSTMQELRELKALNLRG